MKTIGGCLYFQEYRACFEGVGGGTGEKTLEDAFFEHEVRCIFLPLFSEFYFQGLFYCLSDTTAYYTPLIWFVPFFFFQ